MRVGNWLVRLQLLLPVLSLSVQMAAQARIQTTLMARDGITTGLIQEFQEHPVWLAIRAQLEKEQQDATNRMVDAIDLRAAGQAAGQYKTIETVLHLPDIFLGEIETETSRKGNWFGRRTGKGIRARP